MTKQATHYHQQLLKASQALAAMDADWQLLIKQTGPYQLTYKVDQSPYAALLRAVAHQQLNTKVGDVIFNRLLALFDGELPDPVDLRAHDVDALRSCGFSARKIETLKAIAQSTMDALIPSRETAIALPNDDLIRRITTIKGIGPWTVQMMLMFTLNRLDVLPADDLGVREGYKRLKNLDQAPKAAALAKLGENWSPFRTVASWYLWQVPK